VQNDDQIHDTRSQTCPAEDSFLTGWNFSIDLYKVIEHLVDRSRVKKVQSDKTSISFLDTMIDQNRHETSARSLLEMMEGLHDQLPPIFKTVRPMSGDVEADCFGFQGKSLEVSGDLADTYSCQYHSHPADAENGARKSRGIECGTEMRYRRSFAGRFGQYSYIVYRCYKRYNGKCLIFLLASSR
jgi:hypothetical protein